MPPFLDRTDELIRLERLWSSGRAEFAVVTGRRRVGKSQLLNHLFAAKPHAYVVGTAQTARVQLLDVSRELARATGDPLLATQALDNWDAVLAALAQQATRRRFGVVIDEFSYFVDQTPELPSLLQRWWDRVGAGTRIMLVLASSHAGFMDRLLGGDQPLFGRRTAALTLRPFDYADAGRFFPAYAAIDRLRAFGVFGGMPAYLAACDPDRTVMENVARRILEPDAFLRHEPIYLLAQERSVKQPAAYLSLLRAIAGGETQPNLIAQAAGFRAPAEIAPYLERLREFGLVERIVPVTAEPGGRISRYVVADPFLAFWFRYVQPAEALLDRGLASLVLDELRDGAGGLDRFVSRAQGPWERACADFVWRALRAGRFDALRLDLLGPWWQGRGSAGTAEIDLVGRSRGRTVLVASCTWRNEWMKVGDLFDLQRTAAALQPDDAAHWLLFSRSGFDPVLIAHAAGRSIHLIDPDAMFAPDIVDPPAT